MKSTLKMNHPTLPSLFFILFLLLSCFCMLSKSMDMDFPDMTPHAVAKNEYIPFIECQVCEEIVKQLFGRVNIKREEIAPKKLGELEIIEMTEKVCDMKREEGGWIKFLDIVEKKDRLKLKEKDFEGECLTKCKTIHKTCRQLLGDHDTDIAELLFHQKTESQISKIFCTELNKACGKKTPPLPKNLEPLEPFAKKADRSMDMAKMMKEKGLKSSVNHNIDNIDDPDLERFKHKGEDKRQKMDFHNEL